MSPFFSLPVELIDAIVSVHDDRRTLLALAQTCSTLQPFAEARLLKNIYIHDGQSVSRLARDLEQPPWRLRVVEHLEVTPTMYSCGGIELIPELIGRLARLKSLKVELPTINTARKPSWWPDGMMVEYMGLFMGKGALDCLTSFTLHSRGINKRYYNIKEILPVFLSPTLEHLHLSRVDMSGATEAFATLGPESQSIRTPLKTLILQRCIAPLSRPDDFHAVISRPRALRSFTVLLDTDLRQLGMLDTRVHAADFVGAIQKHSDSLEYLRYMHRPIDRPARGSPEHLNPSLFSALSTLHQSSAGLSTFHRLHTFDVDYRSNLTEFLLDKALAPPNLRTLGFTGLSYDYGLSWRHLPAFVSAIASATPFSHLCLYTQPSGFDIADVFQMFSPPASAHTGYIPPYINNVPQRQYALISLVKILDKRTVKLVCLFQERHQLGFCPPFFYGESLPVEFFVFDSTKQWSGERDVDERFEIEEYISEEWESSGWRGLFSGLGNSFWRE